MISDKMANAINEQMNKEMYSAYLYMAMSAYSSELGLKGTAKWFMVQYHEEMFHAMKMYDYIQRQGGTIKLETIDKPPSEWKSPLDLFEKTLAHEQMVTALINDLMNVAIAEKDHATQIFLQWYITEQVEEEENDNDIIAQLKLIGSNSQGLLMLDRDLSTRMANIPLDFTAGLKSGD